MGIDPLARRAVFLDRDGVLNRSVVLGGVPHPPASAAQLEVLPGVQDACLRLRQAGFVLVVVTNQPDVARGLATRESVEEIHARLRSELALDDIRACYHDDSDKCGCRKPAPGLILDAARTWAIALDQSYMVGDRWRDIEAGVQAGCRTVLVDYNYPEKRCEAHAAVSSLSEAAEWILADSRQRTAVSSTEMI